MKVFGSVRIVKRGEWYRYDRARPSHLPALALLLAALLTVTFLVACGDDATAPPPDPPRATTITVSPATADLAALGATVQLSAEVRDQNGQAMAGVAVTWTSGTTAVATADSIGLATAVANGSAAITATAGSASGSAVVTVVQEVSTVAVAVAEVSLAALGDTLRLEAEAFDTNGHPVPSAEYSWASSDEAVATVDSTGLAVAVGAGIATVKVTVGEVTGAATVRVTTAGSATTDREALVALYNATDGPNWHSNTNWLTDAPLEDWYGVATDSVGRVVLLRLFFNNLKGEIPSELGRLASLEWLDLGTNYQLTGGIPSELGGLASLKNLFLSRNQLTGEIPAELGGLASLEWLNLSNNQLTGGIPSELGGLASLEWLNLSNNQLTGGIPPELGGLVSLRELDLSNNQLAGKIPVELGQLTSVRELYLYANTQLAGALPLSLAQLSSMEAFEYQGTGLCVPADASFRAWLLAIPNHSGTGVDCAALSDRDILEVFYHATDGPTWTNSGNWLSDAPLGEWHGVTTDSVGGVTDLDLGSNQLTGEIPPELGGLDSLEVLRLHDNSELAGALPLTLASLSALETFRYDGTGLCVPADASFRTWLNAIPQHVGTGLDCVLDDRDILEVLYNATDGPNWTNNENWLTDAPLDEWYGVYTKKVNGVERVSGIYLGGAFYEAQHGLSGAIPPELGHLSELTALDLSHNDLSGEIPPELGDLANLERLYLDDNDLSGEIPRELGDLADLEMLGLSGNDLSGPIPPELAELANLWRLYLDDNALSGAIPPELGNLANLKGLYLGGNDLSGAIPPELGGLENLDQLVLRGNGLSGAIPPELANLANLEDLWLSNNDLSGPIPPELGGLEHLDQLLLGGNALSGAIPPELANLANLEDLWLSNNDLSGAIPPELANLANLEDLWLSNNDLSGAIPPELGNLAKLEGLQLNGNDLSGAIPPELGDLASLERLFLHSNALSGAIPPTLLELPLSVFWWYSNSGLCAPGTSVFVESAESRDWWSGPFCNASDHAVLTGLYEVAGGGEWTESQGWLGGPALEEWHGVETDSLGRVTDLDLSDNGLSGGLPSTVASLGRLTRLRIDGNALDGRLPLSLPRLDLQEFHYNGTGLCEPADAEFRAWLRGIPSRRGTGVQCGPLTDRDVLVALYEATGGPGWTNSDGWRTEAPLEDWHGVNVFQGRVWSLILASNGLKGEIPPELGDLAKLQTLILFDDYGLSGEIPPELGNLANLQLLHLYRNNLTGPIPGELGDLASLESLALGENNLTGPIPSELGDLASLESLALYDNDLSGEIPPELGDLANLERLSLYENDLSGEIPPELGDLANLERLSLSENDLSGEIPPELGDLASLERLVVDGNNLTGPIPAELGDLASLERMRLRQNELSGAVPPTFGGLSDLTELDLSHNAGMAGAMPAGLRDLGLESLLAGGTDLCVPRERAFEEWLAAIPKSRIALCGEPPAAYLVQAVQSRTHPVPLVAGEDALLRVFVTAAMETTEGIPEVRARFYLNGSERHVADIAGNSAPIPTEIDEGDLSKSANAEIPGRIVQPGLEMVVEIDPGGTLDPSLGVPERIPEEGRLSVEVREMPTLDLTVIPFLWGSDPDSAIIGLVDGMAADPEGHALLAATHVLLPVADIDVTAHVSVATTGGTLSSLLDEVEAIRVLEGGEGHYVGMMSDEEDTRVLGVAHLSGRSSFVYRPRSDVVAHELGHNMSLGHAPCGLVADDPDPSFPDPTGAIGAWGYDFRSARLVPKTRKDHMSYCEPAWTSDYHFTNALRHRLADEGASAAALAAGPVRSLLLWGGVDTTGTPFLNPAFVAEAPPALPDSAGDYAVTGRDANGRELFSLSFAMSVALSEEGEVSSFVFALPVRPGWADALASVTLSGPAGTVTLDGGSDMPMAILRDRVTGRVRGFLRGVEDPSAVQAAADAPVQGTGSLNVLFSRGIPAEAAWRN